MKKNNVTYFIVTIILVILSFILGSSLAASGTFNPFGGNSKKEVSTNLSNEGNSASNDSNSSKDATDNNSEENKAEIVVDGDKEKSSEKKSDEEKENKNDEHMAYGASGVGKNHIPEANGYSYNSKTVRDNLENRDYKGEKIAFLTFDDGVNTEITPKVLKVLKDKNIHATFFIPGKTLHGEDNYQILKDLYAAGNGIAMHSMTHDYELLYPGRVADANRVEQEYLDSIEAMKKVLGDDFDTKVWRYPGGHMSWKGMKEADEALEKYGVQWIDWNTMTGDAQPKKVSEGDIPRPTTVQEVISNFEHSLNFTKNGNQVVILMHDASDKALTAEALPDLIDHLEAEGYKFGILE